MSRSRLTKAEQRAIDGAVAHFEEHRHLFEGFSKALLRNLRDDPKLEPYIHFIKYRLKSSDRLREKLMKKLLERPRGSKPAIDASNVFREINDLAGVRILHLHADQFEEMCGHIGRILERERFHVIEGPVANCWDVEYEQFFKRLGMNTKSRDSMYMSVHYVLETNERTKITFELQVRTLMEEVWGEVSHTIDYPEPTRSIACKEQLKVLARVTSGCTRLVDSIFRSREEFEKQRSQATKAGEEGRHIGPEHRLSHSSCRRAPR